MPTGFIGRVVTAPADATPGRATETLQQPGEECDLLRVGPFLGAGEENRRGEHPLGVESGIHLLETHQAPELQARRHQQDHRQRDLRHDQPSADTPAVATGRESLAR